MTLKSCALFFATSWLFVNAAYAQSNDESIRLFGHDMTWREINEYQIEISVDGNAIADGRRINLREVGVAMNAPYAVIQTDTGGNMCPISTYVIGLSPRATATVDQVEVICKGISWELQADGLLVTAHGNAADPSEYWLWTQDSGLVRVDMPETDTGSGWDALRGRRIEAPYDLLNFKDFVTELKALSGPYWDEVLRALSGPQSGEYDGNVFYGDSCQAHYCNGAKVFVLADRDARKIYLAWWLKDNYPSKVLDPEAIFHSAPALETWPDAHRNLLKFWQDRTLSELR